ncbi:hypothetical protein BJY04DRAFT_221961 [Aspergillus karnatakaensis]|uniref:uncharacterized protein n=1 Tax=Aspergillus karnatakaensis TaxID=1810916 RepID=UPI003CCD9274
MQLKTLILLLASLATTLASPTPDIEVAAAAAVEPSTNDTNTNTLSARSTGVWLDVYHEGNCNSDWQDQPRSGWVWSGQCKNFDSNTYGASLGQVSESDVEWPPQCTLKFWENADCHGKATVHHVADTGVWKSGTWFGVYMHYNCFAVANKASGEFYLGNGASSVLMTC